MALLFTPECSYKIVKNQQWLDETLNEKQRVLNSPIENHGQFTCMNRLNTLFLLP